MRPSENNVQAKSWVGWGISHSCALRMLSKGGMYINGKEDKEKGKVMTSVEEKQSKSNSSATRAGGLVMEGKTKEKPVEFPTRFSLRRE